MKAPEYDGEESVVSYMRRVEEYKLYLKKDKYNVILKFVNEWLKLSGDDKLKTLTDFKYFPEEVLTDDPDYCYCLMEKYNDQFHKLFHTKIKIDQTTNILNYVSHILSFIEFKLMKDKDKPVYTIRMC